MAYTRFVLERGMSGDLLDLHIALAPCIVGYAEIGARLTSDTATLTDGNPYGAWIEMYSSEDYQAVATDEVAFLDDLMVRRAGPGRFDCSLIRSARRHVLKLISGKWDLITRATNIVISLKVMRLDFFCGGDGGCRIDAPASHIP